MLVMTQSGGTLPDGKAMLEHVVTVVLKQAKDGPLTKALARGGIHAIIFRCPHSHATSKGCSHLPGRQWYCETPCYWPSLLLTARQMILPLWIGLQSPRKILMMSGAGEQACKPLKWMMPLLLLPCLSQLLRVFPMPVKTKMFWCALKGEVALNHVLSEVLCQLQCGLLAEALERSGFNEIQDVILMNQAERGTLTFLRVNGVVTPLPQVQKNMLFDVKLFSSYLRLLSISLHSTSKRRR